MRFPYYYDHILYFGLYNCTTIHYYYAHTAHAKKSVQQKPEVLYIHILNWFVKAAGSISRTTPPWYSSRHSDGLLFFSNGKPIDALDTTIGGTSRTECPIQIRYNYCTRTKIFWRTSPRNKKAYKTPVWFRRTSPTETRKTTIDIQNWRTTETRKPTRLLVCLISAHFCNRNRKPPFP